LRALPTVAMSVPDARIVLVGDGDALPDHRATAEALGVTNRVVFAGRKSGENLVNAYRQASVVAVPSTAEAEASPMVLIEAMACGRPVVASRIGGIPLLVNDGYDGLLVESGNVGELAAACIRLLADPDLAAEFGRRGRQKVEADFSWPSRLSAYDQLFTEILVKRASGYPYASIGCAGEELTGVRTHSHLATEQL